MEDRDDGIGSELNTPRDAPIRGSNQQNEDAAREQNEVKHKLFFFS